MKTLLVSDAVIWDNRARAPYPGIQKALEETIEEGNTVFLVSGHRQPWWLNSKFPGVQFEGCSLGDRMNGRVVNDILEANAEIALKASDIIVLGAKKSDMVMAVQSKTLLIR